MKPASSESSESEVGDGIINMSQSSGSRNNNSRVVTSCRCLTAWQSWHHHLASPININIIIRLLFDYYSTFHGLFCIWLKVPKCQDDKLDCLDMIRIKPTLVTRPTPRQAALHRKRTGGAGRGLATGEVPARQGLP